MFRQIVEKKFPLRHAPHIGLLMMVEADQERSDQIEFSQVGQGLESFDLPDYAAHTQQRSKVAKHGQPIQIKSQSLVPEQLSDVKEIPRTAAKIENSLWAHQIDFDLADPVNVDVYPSFEIKKFWRIYGGTSNSVTLANLLETLGIDRFDYSLRLQMKTVRPKKSERVPSCADQGFAIYKLPKFMGKFLESSHRRIDHSLWRSATISTKLRVK